MTLALFLGLAYGLSSLPLKTLFYKIHQFVRHIFSQMEQDSSVVVVSKWQFLIGFVWIFEFIRGLALVWVSQNLLYSDIGAMLTPLLICLALFWSPLALFQPNRQIFWTLLGILTGLWTPLLWLFPMALIPTCILLNSIYFGSLLSLLLMIIPLSFGPDPFLHVPTILGLFVITFFLFATPVFSHFEKKPITLLDNFRKRS